MDDALAATVEKIYLGNQIGVRELVMPLEYIFRAVRTFDPSMLKIPVGSITLKTSRAANAATFADLLRYSDNKPGDIIVWCTMGVEDRLDSIAYEVNAVLQAKDDVQETIVKKTNLMVCIVFTWLFHGSMSRLAENPPKPPRFLVTAVGLDDSDFKLTDLSSLPSFKEAAFPFILYRIPLMSDILPATFKERMRTSIAGNRIFTILKIAKKYVPDIEELDRSIEFLLHPEVVSNAPYLTLHPGHPDNPMAGCMKYMLSAIGNEMQKLGVEIDDLGKAYPNVMIPGVLASMKIGIETARGGFPDIMDLVQNITPIESIREMLE